MPRCGRAHTKRRERKACWKQNEDDVDVGDCWVVIEASVAEAEAQRMCI